MDSLDYEILDLLLENSKMPYSEIGKRLNVSDSTIHFRIKKLIKEKILLGTDININYEKVGFPICSFIFIQVKNLNFFNSVFDSLYDIESIVEIHTITGDFNILVKAVAPTLKDLNLLIVETISKISYIDNVKYTISLNNSKYKKIKLYINNLNKIENNNIV